MPRQICLILAAFACLLPSLAHADYGVNILPAGNFDSVLPTYVPWAGVDDKGNIHGINGKQLAVGDNGEIPWDGLPFGPSVAVGDLNGDGKPDIVMADSRGFFWYFPNTGTATSPAFTQGEVIPIWLGQEKTSDNPEGADNLVPRIQLLDLNDSKKLDIIAGTYPGTLFHIPNTGSAVAPDFKPTLNHDRLLINTRKRGVLWSNYLSPFLTSAFGAPNSLDLIMGEGTYSANSIYLLHNLNSGGQPSYDEDHIKKIIPGMGLEQLTPVVIDWNNDGKPDILCGDRTGDLHLYLNNSKDPDNPTFEEGTIVKIGGVEKLGGFITVAVGDLTGNHLPNLLIGKNDGTIDYALNTGKLGAPVFSTPPTPLKGVLPPEYHFNSLRAWWNGGAWGEAYEMLAATNPDLEPGFKFPEGEKTKYAMRYYIWPFKSTYFPARYIRSEDYWSEHFLRCEQGMTIKLNKRYRIHFWAKANGNISDFRIKLNQDNQDHEGFHGTDMFFPENVGTNWTEVSQDFEVRNEDDKTISTWNYHFEFRFTGQTPFYIDDLQVQEEIN